MQEKYLRDRIKVGGKVGSLGTAGEESAKLPGGFTPLPLDGQSPVEPPPRPPSFGVIVYLLCVSGLCCGCTVTIEREPTKVTIVAQEPFSKRYMKVRELHLALVWVYVPSVLLSSYFPWTVLLWVSSDSPASSPAFLSCST